MKMFRFLARYLVRYWRWAFLALVATVAYAATTVVLIQLIQAIFGEVLRSDGPSLASQIGGVTGEDRSRVFLDHTAARCLADQVLDVQGDDRGKFGFTVHRKS